jgi:replicative DNA helicase
VQEVSEISRDMKEMAQEIHASVILLSQLNRASEMKQKLSMADLRDSGAIEQDASVIMLMWENKSGSRSVSVEKNRQGAKGTIIFDFDGNKMRFTETGKDEEELIDECPFD